MILWQYNNCYNFVHKQGKYHWITKFEKIMEIMWRCYMEFLLEPNYNFYSIDFEVTISYWQTMLHNSIVENLPIIDTFLAHYPNKFGCIGHWN